MSDFLGKSLNSGDGNSQVFLEPQDQERNNQLKEWYKHIPVEEEKAMEKPKSLNHKYLLVEELNKMVFGPQS